MEGAGETDREKDATKKVFAVVKLVEEEADGQKIIDLVPYKWLICTDGIWYCYYPDKDEYALLDYMVKGNLAHKSTWEKFEVVPLKYTKTYSKGEKKLDTACKRPLRMDSTDSELDSDLSVNMPRSQVRSILDSSMSLSQLPTIPEKRQPSKTSTQTVTKTSADNNGDSGGPSKKNVPEVPPIMTRLEKKKMLATNLIKLGQKSEDPETQLILQFIVTQVDLLTLNLIDRIEGVRQGCQGDMKTLKEELQESVFAAYTGTENNKSVNPKTKFTCTFPIEELDGFLQFEKSLDPKDESNSEHPEIALQRQEHLKGIMQFEIGSSNRTYEDAISTILTALIKKNVQIHYSGVGRKSVAGIKKDFSATFTHKCLEDFLKVEYHVQCVDPKHPKKHVKFSSLVGHFLTGAGDREGGANERKKKCVTSCYRGWKNLENSNYLIRIPQK